MKKRNKSHGYADRNGFLKELGFDNYLAYLSSPLWARIRKGVFAAKGNICTLCPARADIVHHLSYTKPVLKGTNTRPLVPLCTPCHKKIEFKPSGKKRTLASVHCHYTQLLILYRKELVHPLPKSERHCNQCNHRLSKTGVCGVCTRRPDTRPKCTICGTVLRMDGSPCNFCARPKIVPSKRPRCQTCGHSLPRKKHGPGPCKVCAKRSTMKNLQLAPIKLEIDCSLDNLRCVKEYRARKG